jgi:hypothetical protein
MEVRGRYCPRKEPWSSLNANKTDIYIYGLHCVLVRKYNRLKNRKQKLKHRLGEKSNDRYNCNAA